MRVVTFQSKEITEALLGGNIVKTITEEAPYKCNPLFKRVGPAIYVEDAVTGKLYDPYSVTEEDTMILSEHNSINRFLHPFAAFESMKVNGTYHPMTAKTICQRAYSILHEYHFQGRSIIELEVPSEAVLCRPGTLTSQEVLLRYLDPSWVVSVLKLVDTFTDSTNNESAYLYKNCVYNQRTYHMCYADEMVLCGGDECSEIPDALMSPFMILHTDDMNIQKEYVQPDIVSVFAKSLYCINHEMCSGAMATLNAEMAIAELPDKVGPMLLQDFNEESVELCRICGVQRINPSSYEKRIPMIKECLSKEQNEYMPIAFRTAMESLN